MTTPHDPAPATTAGARVYTLNVPMIPGKTGRDMPKQNAIDEALVATRN